MERFNLKKLNDVEVKEQYQVKIWNKFSALENLDDDDDDDMFINRTWEIVIQNTKASATEFRLLWVGTGNTIVWRRVLEILRSKEADQIAMISESKSNKLRQSEQCKTWNN
jgi:hypothetical protein